MFRLGQDYGSHSLQHHAFKSRNRADCLPELIFVNNTTPREIRFDANPRSQQHVYNTSFCRAFCSNVGLQQRYRMPIRIARS